MNTKSFKYDDGQKTCIELMENGFVYSFEEIFYLRNLNQDVLKEAGLGQIKDSPQEFCSNLRILQHVQENLIMSEQALRRGAIEDNNNIRMDLGKYLHEQRGYTWLADYFYKSIHGDSVDENVNIASLEKLALLEEDKGNPDIALNYLEIALQISTKSENVEDSTKERLREQLSRISYQLGSNYLEKENELTSLKDAKSLRYLRKAVKLAKEGDNVGNQAICHALLGKALMKHKMEDKALKSFEKYLELCEELNDLSGMCQGYFAKSEVFKRKGNWDEATENLKRCQELAKEHGYESSFIFASISLGQISTAKREYFQASDCFEEAYQMLLASEEDIPDREMLMKLTRVMCGIGRAHLSFGRLISTIRSPSNISLPMLFSWKNKGGPFTGEVTRSEEYDLEETETDKGEVAEMVEKLVRLELQ